MLRAPVIAAECAWRLEPLPFAPTSFLRPSSPHFLSCRAPELIFGAQDYTTAIDVWSCGCVAAELLIGQPLFQARFGSNLTPPRGSSNGVLDFLETRQLAVQVVCVPLRGGIAARHRGSSRNLQTYLQRASSGTSARAVRCCSSEQRAATLWIAGSCWQRCTEIDFQSDHSASSVERTPI